MENDIRPVGESIKEALGEMSEPKFGPAEFKAEVERLKAEGRMPSLEDVLEAVADARMKYRDRILAARKLKRGGDLSC